MKNINIMNGLVNFSAVALLFLLIIFIVFTLFCKKFKFNKKNIELYGLFLNLDTKSLIAISAMTIHYLFLVWCTITFEGLNVIYVSFIFILVLISDVALDDFKKLVFKNTEGLKPAYKMIGLLIVAVAFTLYLVNFLSIGTQTYIPIIKQYIELPIWIYIPFAIFVLLGTTNAVNLTD